MRSSDLSWILSAVSVGLYGSWSLCASPLFPAAGLLVCLLLAVLTRSSRSIWVCLCPIVIVALDQFTVLGKFWPAPSVVAAVLFALGALAFGWSDWLGSRTLRIKPFVVSIVLGIGAAAIVAVWMRVVRPSAEGIPFLLLNSLAPAQLVGVAVGFSVCNSFAEEFIFRGLSMSLVASRSKSMSNILQALAFALLHFKGLPSGLSGSLLAGAFALLMGGLRLRTGSVLYSWVSHLCANLGMAVAVYYYI